MVKRTRQTAMRAGLVALVGLLMAAGVAQARPHKRGRKQREIERHMFTAQYFLLREGDLDAAASEYRKVLSLDHNNVDAALALSEVEIRAKKVKQAVAVLARLARHQKHDARVLHALAMAQQAAGNDKAMVATLKKALAQNPRDGEAQWLLFQRALSRYRAGEQAAKSEALAAARGYLASGYLPNGSRHDLAERTVIELEGDPVALAIYDAKHAYDTAFTESRFGAINQKMADARRGFEKCVAAQPKNQECHYYLGLVYSSVKASEQYDPARAEAELRRAPDRADAHVELAKLLRTEDKLGPAAGELKRALELEPRMARAELELGIVDKLQGHEDDAVTALVAAYRADSLSATADRALSELSKLRPHHPLVTGAMRFGGIKDDVFSTEKFKAAVKTIEDQMGGIDPQAPEQAALEDILARLRRAADADSRLSFRVSVLKTPMVNAFALPDGSIYFTRGLFDFLKRKWPDRKIDANNDVLGFVMAHEMAHVIHRHTVQTLIYQEAVKDSSRSLDPSVLTHVSRLHEIEADRDGIVTAFLAGYQPRGGLDFMEASGKEMEIPKDLDHPTYEERMNYLEEYWTNDVKYAFVSFKLGVAALGQGQRLEASNPAGAKQAFEQAADDFKRFRTTLKGTKEVLNDLGIAYAKLGMIALADQKSPLSRWQTRFSIETQSALKYRGLDRDKGATRGMGGSARHVPWQLREAMSAFDEALKLDPGYLKAETNQVMVRLALGRVDQAAARLGKIRAASGEVELLRGVVSAEQRHWPQAVAAFQRAARARSVSRAARYNLARAYELAGQKAQAKAAYRAYLTMDRGGPWAQAARRALQHL